MSNEKGTHLGEGSRPVSVSFLQVLHNFGIIPAREQYRDINKGVVRSGSSPRAPCGARRPGGAVCELQLRFQSTRPARGATCRDTCAPDGSRVSIHAPRTGRDLWNFGRFLREMCFNPRAPHGARWGSRSRPPWLPMFQSTRPARGATTSPLSHPHQSQFQSTRPARGATSRSRLRSSCFGCFNPRAPHGARQ